MKTGATPVPETSLDEKKRLLSSWITIVEKECLVIETEKDAKMSIYLRMKSRYDGWLATRLRWVTKLEKRLNARKLQLKEIRESLAALETPPSAE